MKNIFIPMQLRCARQRKKLTLAKVSADLEMSLSFLSDIERGSTLPSLKTLIALCDYYNLHIDDAFVYFCGGEE
jgi:transcriptional regulator with XRE-family HTH domain